MSTTSGTTIDLLSSSSGDDYSSVGGGGSRSTPTVEGDEEEEDPFMDCRRLLEEVSSLEAYHAMRLASEATNFGHPEPPRIHLFGLGKGKVKHHSNHRNSDNNNNNNNLLLVVAYTNHSVCAQIIGHDNNHTKSSSMQNDPIHICTLPIMQVTLQQQQQQHHDGTKQGNNKKHANSRTTSAAAATAAAWNEQVITCITVVALQESTLRSSSSSLSPSSAHATDREDDDDDDDNDDASQEEEEEEEEEKTASLLPQHLVSKKMVRSSSSSSSSSVLLKGVVSSGGGVMMDQAYSSMSASSSSSRANAAAAVVKNRRLAVVVGTSENRVYSTEVVYHVHECRIQVVLAETSSVPSGASSSCSLFEVLPKCNTRSNGSSSGHQRSKSKSSSKHNKTTPFFPTGGVASISAFSLPTFSAGRLQPKQHHGKRRHASLAHLPSSMTTYVWITYRDGTLIRMHHAGLFPSVWERGAACEKTLDDMLLHVGGGGTGPSSSTSHDQVSAALVRCQVQLPPLDLDGDGSNDHTGSSSHNNNVTIMPLPRYHASPLAPLPASSLHFDDTDDVDDFDHFIDEDDTGDPQRQADQEEDGPLYSNVYDALVFAGAGAGMDHFPTLCFYTSEESSFPHARGVGDSDAIRGDYDSRTGSGRRLGGSSGGNGDSESAVLGAVVGGTKAFMGGVVGALRWGLSGGGGSSSARASAAAAKTSTTSLGRNTSQFSTTSSTSNINNNSMDDSRSVDYSVGNTSQDGTVATSSGMSVSAHGAGGVDVPSSPFPSLWDHPISLYAGLEFHDAPRKVEFCSIDPDGVLAAVADGLGRVMLIDLTTKQVIRLWKGYREATCHWIQGYCAEREEHWNTNSRTNIAKTAPKPSWKRKSAKYLVVHSRLRRVVEVWKIRHGSRVTSIPVGRDAQIVPCTLGLYPNHLASCFILHRSAPGGSGGGGRSSISCMQANQLEKIQVDQHQRLLQQHQMQHHQEAEFLVATKGGSVGGGRGMLSQHSLRLQHLRQILSTTNFQYSKDDVHQALLQIKALGDLATCLDLIATASVLEERLGVQGMYHDHAHRHFTYASN
jgi:Rab3 GTPase-activating protein regulatory subunit N-terminus